METVNVREDTALLDKAVFNKIRIRNILDMDKLARMGILEVNEKSSVRYITESGQEFTRINIAGGEYLDTLKAGTKLFGNSRVDHCSINVSIGNPETGNLCCYTVAEYAERLSKIQDELLEKYGLETDFSNVTMKEIEINRTFKLDADFQNYYRVFTLIMNNLPRLFERQMDWIDKDGNLRKADSYYAWTSKSSGSKKYMKFKIYNKTKSVEKIITLANDYARVEVRLVGCDKVKTSLGTNKFSELTDEIINDYFDEQIQELIVKPYEVWKEARDKEVIDIMRKRIEINEKHWKVDTLRILQNEEIKRRCPVILDVSELMSLINEVVEDRSKRYKTKQAFREQAEKIEDVFCNNDHLKLEEIVTKLQAKCIP